MLQVNSIGLSEFRISVLLIRPLFSQNLQKFPVGTGCGKCPRRHQIQLTFGGTLFACFLSQHKDAYKSGKFQVIMELLKFQFMKLRELKLRNYQTKSFWIQQNLFIWNTKPLPFDKATWVGTTCNIISHCSDHFAFHTLTLSSPILWFLEFYRGQNCPLAGCPLTYHNESTQKINYFFPFRCLPLALRQCEDQLSIYCRQK